MSKRSFFALSAGGVLAVFVSGALASMAFSAVLLGAWETATTFTVVAALGINAAVANAKELLPKATYRMGRFGLRSAEFVDETVVSEPKDARP